MGLGRTGLHVQTNLSPGEWKAVDRVQDQNNLHKRRWAKNSTPNPTGRPAEWYSSGMEVRTSEWAAGGNWSSFGKMLRVPRENTSASVGGWVLRLVGSRRRRHHHRKTGRGLGVGRSLARARRMPMNRIRLYCYFGPWVSGLRGTGIGVREVGWGEQYLLGSLYSRKQQCCQPSRPFASDDEAGILLRR